MKKARTFTEFNESISNEEELNEAVDVFIAIAEALDVSLDVAKMIVALAGVTGTITFAAAMTKIQDVLAKKNPKLSKKLGDITKGANNARTQ